MISNIRRVLLSTYQRIDWPRYFPKLNRCQTYGFPQLVWLSFILTALGYNSYRDQHQFLQTLHRRGVYEAFLRLCGLVWAQPDRLSRLHWAVPAISTLHEAHAAIQDVEGLQQAWLSHRPPQLDDELQRRGFAHIALDGKDVRQSGKPGALKPHNVKTLNAVMGSTLIASEFIENEAAWIKQNLGAWLHTLQTQMGGLPLLWTGDAIYNTPTLRRVSHTLGVYYVLPAKHNCALRAVYEKWALRRAATALTDTVVFQRKGRTIHDRIQLIPIGRAATSWAVRIERTVDPKGAATTTTHWLSTNCPVENTLEHLHFLYEIKREHWQVETFHKVKDERFEEDRYRKTPDGARRRSLRVNGALRLMDWIGFSTKKHPRQAMKATFLADFEAWLLWRALKIMGIF